MKTKLISLITTMMVSTTAFADIVYVTARPQGCTVTANCPGPNIDGTYYETNFPNLGDFGAVGTALGHPQTTVARTYISSAVITDTTAGVDVRPVLGFPGTVYQIDYNFNSVAGNTSTNVVYSVTASGGTLSFASTDKFQRQYGSPASQWQFMGYITNDVGNATPNIQFRYQSGRISGAGASSAQNRMLFDCWRFTLLQPCLAIPVVSVTGPLSTNLNAVAVTGVSATATNVFVYQDSGAGMTLIGSKTTGVTAGNNTVTVAGLIKDARVAATQKINGQEGCIPTIGTLVGGGANPRVRVVVSIRETTDTGPAGAVATDTSSVNIHFLGASAVLGSPSTASGAPAGGTVIYSSNDWQTVTFLRGTNEVVGDSSNVTGTNMDGSGYAANDTVTVQVYAFRTLPNAIKIFSSTPAQSADVTSNNLFNVNWTWDAVAGANGYRLLRTLNSGGYNEFLDVNASSFNDTNSGWTVGNTVTPITSQPGASVRWNPSLTTNNLPGTWGILESINFAIDDLSDTGPYDVYIDNLKNGSTTWQTFENSVSGTQEVSFRSPSFSGTTGDNILGAPNRSVVSIRAADTGTKSLRVRFQWSGTNATRWLRLTTSGVGNPLVNLDDPISFRLLMQPVGASPAQPPPAVLSISNNAAGQSVLGWTGAHNLQAASLVSGTYTNLSGVTTAPWTNTFGEPAKFFRLADPYDN